VACCPTCVLQCVANVLQCVAVYCSMLQCVACMLHVCCSVLKSALARVSSLPVTCCSTCVLQICCSVLQCVAVYYVLHVCCGVLQCVTINTLQRTHRAACHKQAALVRPNSLRFTATYCNTHVTHMQHTCNTHTTHCNTLQYTATHCNTLATHLQHTYRATCHRQAAPAR